MPLVTSAFPWCDEWCSQPWYVCVYVCVSLAINLGVKRKEWTKILKKGTHMNKEKRGRKKLRTELLQKGRGKEREKGTINLCVCVRVCVCSHMHVPTHKFIIPFSLSFSLPSYNTSVPHFFLPLFSLFMTVCLSPLIFLLIPFVSHASTHRN